MPRGGEVKYVSGSIVLGIIRGIYRMYPMGIENEADPRIWGIWFGVMKSSGTRHKVRVTSAAYCAIPCLIHPTERYQHHLSHDKANIFIGKIHPCHQEFATGSLQSAAIPHGFYFCPWRMCKRLESPPYWGQDKRSSSFKVGMKDPLLRLRSFNLSRRHTVSTAILYQTSCP